MAIRFKNRGQSPRRNLHLRGPEGAVQYNRACNSGKRPGENVPHRLSAEPFIIGNILFLPASIKRPQAADTALFRAELAGNPPAGAIIAVAFRNSGDRFFARAIRLFETSAGPALPQTNPLLHFHNQEEP